MTSRLAASLALLLLVTGCGGVGGPHFAPASGWQLLSRDGELAAANVPFAAGDRGLASPPSHTVASLPRRGIVIWLLVMRRRKAVDRSFPPVPLRVGRAVATNPPEGFFCPPASRARCFAAGGAIRRMQARMAGWDVGLTVFFGTDHPTPGQVRAADAELGRFSP